MPPPLDPSVRAAILVDIKTGVAGRNEIARAYNVSPGTVTNIAAAEGIETAFDRTSTERATEAARLDMAAWRTSFAERVARRVEWVEARFDEQQPVVIGTKKGAEIVYTDATSTDVRNLMTALGIAVDKIAVLTRDDSQGLAAVDAWLHSLGVGQTTA